MQPDDRTWAASLSFKETRTRNEHDAVDGGHVSEEADVRLERWEAWRMKAAPGQTDARDRRPIARLAAFLKDGKGVYDAIVCQPNNEWEPARIEVHYNRRQRRVLRDDAEKPSVVDEPTGAEDHIRATLQAWREGRLAVPSVSTDVHARMVTAGVAIRDDGLWGFKLRCRRDGCDKVIDKCFAHHQVEDAIKQANERRSQLVCSTTCGFQADGIGPDDWWPDIWNDMHSGVGEGKEGEKVGQDLLRELCEASGIRVAEGEDDDLEVLPDGSPHLKAIAEKNPDLYKRFVDWFDEHNDPDYDADPEDGETTCEV